MPTDFASLKKTGKNAFQKLTEELGKLNSNQSNQQDDRFWRPEVDKAGNGYAVIRFLPAPKGEGDIPFVRLFDHAFKGPNGWFIDGCLTSVNEACPVCEYNKQLWDTGSKENQDTVRKQKRKLSYISNVYIVSDPKHPENEGKVFLFKYGKKIYDKLNAAMNPEFEDEQPINPFDFWEGANFKLKIRKVEGYQNYDKSEFDKPSALLDDDDELENVWLSEHSLTSFLERGNFKTYDEVKGRLNKVMSLGIAPVKQTVTDNWDDEEEVVDAPLRPTKVAKQAKAQEQTTPWDEQEDEDLSMFQKLASD